MDKCNNMTSAYVGFEQQLRLLDGTLTQKQQG